MITYYQIQAALQPLDLTNLEQCAAMHIVKRAQEHGFLATCEIRAFEEILSAHDKQDNPLIQQLWDEENNGYVDVQKWADMTNEAAEEAAGS